MDRFLQNMGPKNKTKVSSKAAKTVPQDHEELFTATPYSPGDVTQASHRDTDIQSECASEDFTIDYKKLAIEVATRISPDIQETLAETVTNMFTKLQAEVSNHGQRLDDIESRVQSWETTADEMHSHIQSLLSDNRRLSEKVDDLENRSRRNNLRIVGLPESILPAELPMICEKELPEILGLTTICKVERAHRLGPDLRMQKGNQNTSAKNKIDRPRQVIVKYLDYSDKTSILRLFRSFKGGVNLRGHKILVFGDFSAEVTQKRKAFSVVCTALFHRQTRFALLYPAVLKVFVTDGPPKVYRSPRRRV